MGIMAHTNKHFLYWRFRSDLTQYPTGHSREHSGPYRTCAQTLGFKRRQCRNTQSHRVWFYRGLLFPCNWFRERVFYWNEANRRSIVKGNRGGGRVPTGTVSGENTHLVWAPRQPSGESHSSSPARPSVAPCNCNTRTHARTHTQRIIQVHTLRDVTK